MPKEIMPHRPTAEQVKSIGAPQHFFALKADDLTPEEIESIITLFRNAAPGRIVGISPEIPPASFTEEAAMQNVEMMLESVGEPSALISMETEPATEAEHNLVHQAVEGLGVEVAAEVAAEGVLETLVSTLHQAKIDTGFTQCSFARSPLVPEEAMMVLVNRFAHDLDQLNEKYVSENLEVATDGEVTPNAVWPFPSGATAPDVDLFGAGPVFTPEGGEISIAFQKDLEQIINKHSIENHFGMPDFVLAETIVKQMQAMAWGIWRTEQWKR